MNEITVPASGAEVPVVARFAGVELWVPEGVRFSVFNSPYPAHAGCGALDVYFDGEALMPAEEGVVREVRWFRGPRPRSHGPGCQREEPVILIDLPGGLVLKVMHVEPSVSPGERLTTLDPMGRVVRSCYLCPWSDAHAHFELKLGMPYRASGWATLDLSPALTWLGDPSEPSEEFTVDEVRDEYVWLLPRRPGSAGLVTLVGGVRAHVDGGLPHYGHGAALVNPRSLELSGGGEGEGVTWADGTPLGEPTANLGFGVTFRPAARPVADGLECVGVGSYLAEPRLKLIVRRGEHPWSEGDVLRLRFAPLDPR